MHAIIDIAVVCSGPPSSSPLVLGSIVLCIKCSMALIAKARERYELERERFGLGSLFVQVEVKRSCIH